MQLRCFSSVFLSHQVCFILGTPTQYWVQAIFLLITVHKNGNQALQHHIQYLGLLGYWRWNRCYVVFMKPPVFLAKVVWILKMVLFPLNIIKFRNEWASIPNLRESCLHLSSKTGTNASLLNITYKVYIQRAMLKAPSLWCRFTPQKMLILKYFLYAYMY